MGAWKEPILFLKVFLYILKPDVTSQSVLLEQTKQKSNHDRHSQSCEYFVGQNLQAHKFCEGPRWAPGVIVERLGPLTYLVQMDTGVFWRRHVDHLRTAHDKSPDTSKTIPSTSLSSELSNASDFIPIVDSDQSSIAEQRTEQPVTDRRYPKRLNRRSPASNCS